MQTRQLGPLRVSAIGLGSMGMTPIYGRPDENECIATMHRAIERDRRREHPRFAQESLERDLALLETLRAVAAAKDRTPAQVALAWLLHQGDEVVPIAGTKQPRYLEENVRALNLRLDQADLASSIRPFHPASPPASAIRQGR